MKYRYAVVKCPNCGHYSISHFSAKRHRCPYCGHAFLLRPKRSLSRIVEAFNDIRDARLFVYELR